LGPPVSSDTHLRPNTGYVDHQLIEIATEKGVKPVDDRILE
jgi:hypothetical protein